MVALLHPRGVLITGGPDPDPENPGLFRVYVGPRYRWRYVLVGEDGAAEVRRAGNGQHVVTVLPDDAVLYEDRDALAENEWARGRWDEYPP